VNHRPKLSTAPWEVHSLAAGLALEPQWTPQNGRGGAKISLNHPLAVPGPVHQALLALLGRWCSVHQSLLHVPGKELWLVTGIHHALKSGTKWDGGAGDQDTQRVMLTPPSLSEPATR
jgi:hypothetical protein